MTAISCNPISDDRKFFFASKLFFLAIVAKIRLETLPLDVFFWFAKFILADLLCIR